MVGADALPASAERVALPTVLSALPHAVALQIFALLPVDLRARCAAVCRGWRALLADAGAWTRLDLSDDCGVTVRLTARVLLGAAARAGGALQTLDVNREDGAYIARGAYIDQELLLQVITANAATLRELHMGPGQRSNEGLAALLRAAPALRELSANVFCTPEVAPALLRNEPPFGPLRMHTLCVRRDVEDKKCLCWSSLQQCQRTPRCAASSSPA
jgi:hypothetical protein